MSMSSIQDSLGRSYVLFPIPESNLSNPLRVGARHSLPGSAWQVDSTGGREAFLIVASRKPLPDLERELAMVKRASLDTPAEVPRDLVSALRGIGTVAKEEPRSDAPGTSRNIRKSLKKLGDPEEGGGVWIREVLLENPGT